MPDSFHTGSVAAALDIAKRRYASTRPKSLARWQEAALVMPGGNTRTNLYFEPFPICMVRGEECYLFDADGHRYVDMLGEYTAGIYGHSNPVIRDALIRTLDNGLSLSAHTDLEVGLAQLICKRFDSIERVRFTNSGTEANLMAIATAVAATGRQQVMVFKDSYHGGVLTFSGESKINVPHPYVLAQYNDVSGVQALLRECGNKIACILVEPMLGAAGCIPASAEFLQMLVEEARPREIVLIFDEIQTSRLAPGGRQSILGIRPDLTTLGKYFGGGLSFGAFGGRADLMMQYDPRRPDHLKHAGTFNNNVLSMAAGYAGLSKVLTEEALSAVNSRGDTLREKLNEIFAQSRASFHVTGLGSLMTVRPKASAPHGRSVSDLLFFDLLERGYYCAPRGLVALSLVLGDAEVSGFVAAMQDVISSRAAIYCE